MCFFKFPTFLHRYKTLFGCLESSTNKRKQRCKGTKKKKKNKNIFSKCHLKYLFYSYFSYVIVRKIANLVIPRTTPSKLPPPTKGLNGEFFTMALLLDVYLPIIDYAVMDKPRGLGTSYISSFTKSRSVPTSFISLQR